MVHVAYGVWDGKVRDNRGKLPVDMPPEPDLNSFEWFNDGNHIRAFVGDRGFMVFDPDLNLIDTMWRHMVRAAEESCGKCTPCRVGAPLIRDALEEVLNGKAHAGIWSRIETLSRQMAETSLCYLGKTSANALLAAMEHFPDQFAHGGKRTSRHNGMSYVTAPCVEACPSKLAVPRYIDYIKDGRADLSLGVILQKYPMAATCGRVCVRFCEMACRRNTVDEPVGIKLLKRFVADQQKDQIGPVFSPNLPTRSLPDNVRVAVVGAGPAGVSCAYHLLLLGHHVDVIEAEAEAGGMARSGIPSYRLPKDVLKAETDTIVKLGGRFIFNRKLGRDCSIDTLFEEGYKAVFLGLGCAKGTLLGIEGEDASLAGYRSGIDFLLDVHNHVEHEQPLTVKGEVAVIGGGNVAMDCVRSALRLGADKVHLIYRRTEADMPADHEEIEAAHREGVIFHCLSNPARIVSKDGRVIGVELSQMRQTVADKKGRIGVEAIPGAETFFPCDLIIAAIGQQIDKETLKVSDGVQLDKWGCVAHSEPTLQTTRAGVFAGGDCASGASTLIHAMAQGLHAARAIDDYLLLGHARFSGRTRMRKLLNDNKMMAGECFEAPVAHQYRIDIPSLSPQERARNFEEVEQPIVEADAYREANRCLRCYRVYSVVTETAVPSGER